MKLNLIQRFKRLATPVLNPNKAVLNKFISDEAIRDAVERFGGKNEIEVIKVFLSEYGITSDEETVVMFLNGSWCALMAKSGLHKLGYLIATESLRLKNQIDKIEQNLDVMDLLPRELTDITFSIKGRKKISSNHPVLRIAVAEAISEILKNVPGKVKIGRPVDTNGAVIASVKPLALFLRKHHKHSKEQVYQILEAFFQASGLDIQREAIKVKLSTSL